jgi:hypothetical protein
VLQALIAEGLYVKAEKSEFDAEEITFLGQVILRDGIRMCPTRANAIREYPMPSSLKEVERFLGLVNAYRRHSSKFADMALPLNALQTKITKSRPFIMTDEAKKAVEGLKELIYLAPTMRHFEETWDTMVETDASGTTVAGILSQQYEDGFHPVAFFSRKLKHTETNYDVHDQELLAVVECVNL